MLPSMLALFLLQPLVLGEHEALGFVVVLRLECMARLQGIRACNGRPGIDLVQTIGKSIQPLVTRRADDSCCATDCVSPHDMPEHVEPATSQLECRPGRS